MPDANATTIYGPYGAVVIMFLLQVLWPFIKDRLYPDLVAERRARIDLTRKESEAAQKREDRVFEAFQESTKVMTSLQSTLGAIHDQQREMISAFRDLNEDVAGLYGHLQKPRPSRAKSIGEGK